MKLGIVVGHSKKSQGARNKDIPSSEYDLNEELAIQIKLACDRLGISSETIYRKTGYKKLPQDINNVNPEYCICVHHNGAADPEINGTETLYYHKSKTSKKFAKIINDEMSDFLGFKNRGIKPVDSEDRGGYVLKYTNMPCILIEPYFMTNTNAVLSCDVIKLAEVIAKGFLKFNEA